jgi:IS1 family transposase
VHFVPLQTDENSREKGHQDSDLSPSQRSCLKATHLFLDICELLGGCWLGCFGVTRLGYLSWRQTTIGFAAILMGWGLAAHGGFRLVYRDKVYHKKCLTNITYCNTVSVMANVLSAEKQTAIIAALAEGSSIRSIERITGVHRDTIMRLGVKVGQGCTALLDEKMRNLPCRLLQFDEVWGFVGKKERHVRPDDDPQYGNVWTFCAIDAETKLVPSFKCGKRDLATAKTFVADVQSRMAGRVQISSDALKAYQDAIEQTFGADVDFGQIIKTYEHDDSQNAERKYGAAKFVSVEKRSVTGSPDMSLVSTSYIERLNATTRLHMRRLTRLTLAFSKKLENFEAAVGLHFAYYNLVKRHNSLRCTPAMAAGVERDFWSVHDLVEAAA